MPIRGNISGGVALVGDKAKVLGLTGGHRALVNGNNIADSLVVHAQPVILILNPRHLLVKLVLLSPELVVVVVDLLLQFNHLHTLVLETLRDDFQLLLRELHLSLERLGQIAAAEDLELLLLELDLEQLVLGLELFQNIMLFPLLRSLGPGILFNCLRCLLLAHLEVRVIPIQFRIIRIF